MKMLKFLLLTILSSSITLSADAASEPSDSDQNTQQSKPKQGSKLPLILRRNNSVGGLKAPGIALYGTVEVRENSLYFTLPIESAYWNCELEHLTDPYGYWSGSFESGETCELYFDGSVGDYKLTLSGAEGSYVGYFTLE